MQSRYECVFCLAALHSLTVPQQPPRFRGKCYDLVALYPVCGIDHERSTVFVQSHVPAHVELARDLAERFNARYGQTFVVPRHVIPPASKMSKTDPTPAQLHRAGGRPGHRRTEEPPRSVGLTEEYGMLHYAESDTIRSVGTNETAGPRYCRGAVFCVS